MRLDKYLSAMGVDSRSEVKKLIKAGKVTVNGAVETDSGRHVSEADDICVRGKTIGYIEHVYYMLHKPAGVITATEDSRQETVMDLFAPEDLKRKGLFPVGRLDKDTEGLLLVTDDGDLNHRLLSPTRHVDKTYYALIDGIVTPDDVERFAEGLYVDEELTAQPAVLNILETDEIQGQSRIEVTIREGKYHQVKRMFHAVGKEVVYLKRLSMGSLTLDETLAKGEYRKLTEAELKELKEC